MDEEEAKMTLWSMLIKGFGTFPHNKVIIEWGSGQIIELCTWNEFNQIAMALHDREELDYSYYSYSEETRPCLASLDRGYTNPQFGGYLETDSDKLTRREKFRSQLKY